MPIGCPVFLCPDSASQAGLGAEIGAEIGAELGAESAAEDAPAVVAADADAGVARRSAAAS